jgi:hypothetical protein
MKAFEIEMTQLAVDGYLGNEGYRTVVVTGFEVTWQRIILHIYSQQTSPSCSSLPTPM